MTGDLPAECSTADFQQRKVEPRNGTAVTFFAGTLTAFDKNVMVGRTKVMRREHR